MKRLKELVRDALIIVGIRPITLKRLILGKRKTFDECDLVLAYAKETGWVGTLIDVGACYGAVSHDFLRLGWTSFAIEPDKNKEKVSKLGDLNVSRVLI